MAIEMADPSRYPPELKKAAQEKMAFIKAKAQRFYYYHAGNVPMAVSLLKDVLENPYSSIKNVEGGSPELDDAIRVTKDFCDIKNFYSPYISPWHSYMTENIGGKISGVNKTGISSNFILDLPDKRGTNLLGLDVTNTNYGDSRNISSIFFTSPTPGIPDELINKSYKILDVGQVSTYSASYSISTSFLNGIGGLTVPFVHEFIQNLGFGLDLTHTSALLTEYIYPQAGLYKSTNDFYPEKSVSHPFSSDKLGWTVNMDMCNWVLGPTGVGNESSYKKWWYLTAPIITVRGETLNRNADSIYSYVHKTDASNAPVLDPDGNYIYDGIRPSALNSSTTSVGFRLNSRRIPLWDDASRMTFNFRYQTETNPITNTENGLMPSQEAVSLNSVHLGLNYGFALSHEKTTTKAKWFLTTDLQAGLTDMGNKTNWTSAPGYTNFTLGIKRDNCEFTLGCSNSSDGKGYSAQTISPKMTIKW